MNSIEMHNALVNCNNQCDSCKAKIGNMSCKEFRRKYERYATKKHAEFYEVLDEQI